MEDSNKKNEGGQYNKDDNNLEISDNLCCICYNKNLTLFLNCNHIICLECITNIKKLCCPLCRAELSYLPKKIINIINGDSTSLGISNSNYNYLSLLHNVRPLSLSSNSGILNNASLLPLSYNSQLSSLPLPMTFTRNTSVNDNHNDNDLSLYEQYFNNLTFVDIDDIIHYGFINSDEIGNNNGNRNSDGDGDDSRNSNSSRNNERDNRNSDGDSRNSDGDNRNSDDSRNSDGDNRYSRYFDRANESESDSANESDSSYNNE